ncbi:MAG: (d)CMP kinase [Halanaerobiales bacterium]|nr:(d)CMP kinase [Halanaerobiales bacterium]
MTVSIAIDGPAAAGKSTIAKLLANRLNFIYLDSGAMYRAVTLTALNRGINLNNQEKLKKLVADIDIEIQNKDGKLLIFVNGQNVTEEIRTNRIDKNVSKVAQIKAVRNQLVQKQRRIAKRQNIVMDGRDITTRVLPNADFKFYITATVETRAKRRYQEVLNRNEKSLDIDQIKKDIIKRDSTDTNREHSPLKRAEDAVLIDTTNLNIEEVYQKIIKHIKESN